MRAERILDIAGQLACGPEQLDDDEAIRQIPGVNEAVADLAVLAVATGAEDAPRSRCWPGGACCGPWPASPVSASTERNRLTDGRLGVARMIGNGSDARQAHLGLIELAASVCRPAEPACVNCPLSQLCRGSQADAQRDSLLF